MNIDKQLFTKNITKMNASLCWHLLLLSLLLILFQAFQSELLFQRNSINEGQLWRILTGNWVHTNYYHLLMNLTGLGFICLLFKDHFSIKHFYISLFMTTIAVGLGLYFFSPQLMWYAGLSGALYGLYIIAASAALKNKDYIASIPILIAIPAKLIWDSQHNDLIDSSAELIGAPIATDAHIYGLIAGIMLSIFFALSAIIVSRRSH
ncbi:MAG: rhombosortase [Thiotrichaceae bacterium]